MQRTRNTSRVMMGCVILTFSIAFYVAVSTFVHHSTNMIASALPGFVHIESIDSIVPNVEMYEMYSILIPEISVRSEVAVPPASLWDKKQWSRTEEAMQVAMEVTGAVAYPNSVLPGHNGAIFITAHSSPPLSTMSKTIQTTLFERLPELEDDSRIFILDDTMTYEYSVVSKKIVSPSNVEILEYDYTEPLLHLITCYPIGSTADRLVVSAKLVAQYVN